MKKIVINISIIFTCLLLIYIFAYNKQVKVVYGSDIVVVDNVEVHSPESRLSVLVDTSGVQQFFAKYFTAPSVEVYNKLFIQGESPNISVKEFQAWKEYLSQRDLSLLGVVDFKVNGQPFSLAQYKVEGESEIIIAGLLIKPRNKRLFPCSKQEINRYRDIKEMIERHKLKSLERYLYSNNELSKRELSIIKGRSSHVLSVKVDGKKYMSNLNKLLSINNKNLRQFAKSILYPAMQVRKPEGLVSGGLNYKIEVYKEYLSSIDCSEATQARLVEMVMDGNFLGAAMAIQDHIGES